MTRDFKCAILKVLDESKEPKPIKDLVDLALKTEKIKPEMAEKAVDWMLTDLTALTAASMIIKNGRAEDQTFKITEKGKQYLIR